MFEKLDKLNGKPETIQEIAVKLTNEQDRVHNIKSGSKERTVFVLGSSQVGKSTVINNFLGRDNNNNRNTLALEYSFSRRSSPYGCSPSQHVNIWELGSIENSEELIKVPFQLHGLENTSAVVMLDLSKPQYLWLELGFINKVIRSISEEIFKNDPIKKQTVMNNAIERVKKDLKDLNTLDLFPFPVVFVGGKYDIFVDFDSVTKKQIATCLRSIAHLTGSCLLFYSNKISKLSKTLRDTLSHLSFGSPTNPFRSHNTEDTLSIWYGAEDWEHIGVRGPMSIELIGDSLTIAIPQKYEKAREKEVADPGKDEGFRESVIDEMALQKYEELQAIIRESQHRGKFESVNNGKG